MKRKALLILLLLTVALLSGCEVSEVGDWRGNRSNGDWVRVNIEKGHHIARQAYSIIETENGYDVVVHIERDKE